MLLLFTDSCCVCCGGGREPKCSTTISCPSEEARCHLFSDQCTVPGADGGVGSLFIFMWIQNTQSQYPELHRTGCLEDSHTAACLPPPPPAPSYVAVPTFTFLTRGSGETGQRRPGGGQIVTGCSESGAGGGNQGAPPYYGTRPRPGGAA